MRILLMSKTIYFFVNKKNTYLKIVCGVRITLLAGIRFTSFSTTSLLTKYVHFT